MKRKEFIQRSTLGGVGFTLPITAWLNSCADVKAIDHSAEVNT